MPKRHSQRTLFDAQSHSAPEPGAATSPPGTSPSEAPLSEPLRPERTSSAEAPVPFAVGELAGKSVYVVDAHGLIYQLFHAMGEMTSPMGEPVAAVYGFVRDMLFLLETRQPDYLFCAFDMPGKTFRHDVFPEYKAQRPEMPEDLIPQLSNIRRALEVMGIPALGAEGYEADDVLATLAERCRSAGARCVLVTTDKDCRQLVDDRVVLYNVRKDTVFDAAALAEEWGIEPGQVVDFLALVGDKTDNVPGVPLIGPKIAGELLRKYGSLDAVLDHAAEVPQAKRRENLLAGRDQALISRELVRLDRHVPLAIDWAAGRAGQIDREAARRLFDELGFRGLARKVDSLAERLAHRSAAGPPRGYEEESPGRQPEVSVGQATAGASPGPEPPQGPTFHLVDHPEAFTAFFERLRTVKEFSFDTETTHVWPRWARLVGLSFAFGDEEAWYLPVRAPEDARRLDETATLGALRPILEDAGIAKIGQNLKYDWIVLRGAGVSLRGIGFDTMVADYLLEAGRRNHNLDELAQRYLAYETTKITDLIGKGARQRRMDEVPTRQIADYAGQDALLPWRLRRLLEARLESEGLMGLFREVEMPLVEILAALEYAGIRVDRQRLAELSEEYGRRVATIERDIHELAGRELNIGSPKQLREVLFEELGLPAQRKTKTGASTDAAVLEALAHLHPLPAKIVEYRHYSKLKSTYLDALPAMLHPDTGRVHATFHQTVAATGRLSSSDPNLQNIPVRDQAGREIRSAFTAGEPGWRLLLADYSQIELRVLAHYCGDEGLCAAFYRDEDVHARVAGEIYNVPLSGVTPEMRRRAKAVNFGVIYGQSPFGLARQLGIAQHEAAQFIEAYFAGYPGIEEFLSHVLETCHRQGYVTTLLGRRRAIRGVRADAPRHQRNLPERTAINTVIQGSAADLIKLAMLAVQHRLTDEGLAVRMLLQIHDELVFESPAEEIPKLSSLVTDAMAGVYSLNVPLKVDVKIGDSWADAEPV